MLWTIGAFALNFGPVIVGGILDLIGPKLTSIVGKRNEPFAVCLGLLVVLKPWH